MRNHFFNQKIVGIATFGSMTTQCCGRSILSNYGSNVNWDIVIIVLASLYPLFILIEIIPVTVYQLPLNLFNPLLGLLIGFSIFLTDGLLESMIMWILETVSVICSIVECLLHKEKYRMIETKRKKLAQQTRELQRRDRPSVDSMSTIFTDESLRLFDNSQRESKRMVDDYSRRSLTFSSDIESQRFSLKKQDSTMMIERAEDDAFRIKREHRHVVKKKRKAEFNLFRFSLLVCVNVFVTCLMFLLIFVTWQNGGICVVDYELGNIFKDNQIDKCNRCWTDVPAGVLEDAYASGPCQVCEPDGESQCYFPFRWDA